MEGNNTNNMISLKKKITEVLDILSEQIDSCLRESYDNGYNEGESKGFEKGYNNIKSSMETNNIEYKIGDEVKTRWGIIGVIIDIDDSFGSPYGIKTKDRFTFYNKEDIELTGRHYDELERIFNYLGDEVKPDLETEQKEKEYKRYLDELYDCQKAIERLAEIIYTRNKYYDCIMKLFNINESKLYSNFYNFRCILEDNYPEILTDKIYTAIHYIDAEEKRNKKGENSNNE